MDPVDLERLAGVLRQLEILAGASRDLEHELIQLLHDSGYSWETIGEAAGGISRQAARKKWVRPRRRQR